MSSYEWDRGECHLEGTTRVLLSSRADPLVGRQRPVPLMVASPYDANSRGRQVVVAGVGAGGCHGRHSFLLKVVFECNVNRMRCTQQKTGAQPWRGTTGAHVSSPNRWHPPRSPSYDDNVSSPSRWHPKGCHLGGNLEGGRPRCRRTSGTEADATFRVTTRRRSRWHSPCPTPATTACCPPQGGTRPCDDGVSSPPRRPTRGTRTCRCIRRGCHHEGGRHLVVARLGRGGCHLEGEDTPSSPEWDAGRTPPLRRMRTCGIRADATLPTCAWANDVVPLKVASAPIPLLRLRRPPQVCIRRGCHLKGGGHAKNGSRYFHCSGSVNASCVRVSYEGFELRLTMFSILRCYQVLRAKVSLLRRRRKDSVQSTYATRVFVLNASGSLGGWGDNYEVPTRQRTHLPPLPPFFFWQNHNLAAKHIVHFWTHF